MYADSSARVRHFDGVRQKYMNYALLIFAALFTLGGRYSLPLQCSTSVTVTILMGVFCAFDRHLHRLSHQWQSHANLYYELTCDLLNEPNNTIQWDKWESEHSGPAEWNSFQPVIYYCLVGISLLSLPLWILIARLQ
jgi:vacuolar-type H+-ATPase catalytic subunit A/Vma1